VREPDPTEARDLLAGAEGLVRMVTLAPELQGTAALQQILERAGVLVALGHSLASSEDVDAAVRRGARHVTHLFNAMGTLHHRAPGLAGAALADDRLSCDVICDGIHVDPRMIRLAARAKRELLLMITDRIDPPARECAFGSGPLHDDGAAWRLADGRLAGSRATLARSIATVRARGALTRLEAIAACTLRPARLLGLEAEIGTLRAGARADLALLDDRDALLETWVAGRRVQPAA
jgi:N-acetylglucosamine-6-phosphate deacetylase